MALDTSKPELQSIGNYELISKLAEGGMGWVYKGRQKQSGQIVAIKIVPAHMARNETLLRRFEQEWLAASKLDHANIVRALDYCGTVSTPFLYSVATFPVSTVWGSENDRLNEPKRRST